MTDSDEPVRRSQRSQRKILPNMAESDSDDQPEPVSDASISDASDEEQVVKKGPVKRAAAPRKQNEPIGTCSDDSAGLAN